MNMWDNMLTVYFWPQVSGNKNETKGFLNLKFYKYFTHPKCVIPHVFTQKNMACFQVGIKQMIMQLLSANQDIVLQCFHFKIYLSYISLNAILVFDKM